ncbi:hypothetical protein [Roseovarius sp. E0-M6]|uniref:hypothetical protein n=1 Tax=Roseovarius sp. E0-M6 TaxID=3127118 RepID=UPI00300FB9E9
MRNLALFAALVFAAAPLFAQSAHRTPEASYGAASPAPETDEDCLRKVGAVSIRGHPPLINNLSLRRGA